jgi:glyoxylate reductase
MPTILVTDPIPEAALRLLQAAGEVRIGSDPAGADAVLSLVTTRVDEAFLDAAGPGLRIVANVAVGHDNVDLPACRRRGVVVSNTPGVLTEATADVAMALILMCTRRLGEAERRLRSGRAWSWGMDWFLGSGIQGARLGVVGMGRIGTATARRARAHGMEIVYAGRRSADPVVVDELGAVRLELAELFATADVVSLHCPSTPETHHLVDRDRLASMRPSAYLVNTARGAVVDEGALAEALAAGTIAGAGLDVYEDEPAVHPALLVCENAVLLPHVGSATVATREAMAVLAARNALAVLAGDAPLTPVW